MKNQLNAKIDFIYHIALILAIIETLSAIFIIPVTFLIPLFLVPIAFPIVFVLFILYVAGLINTNLVHIIPGSNQYINGLSIIKIKFIFGITFSILFVVLIIMGLFVVFLGASDDLVGIIFFLCIFISTIIMTIVMWSQVSSLVDFKVKVRKGDNNLNHQR